jgi:hypothetical protein
MRVFYFWRSLQFALFCILLNKEVGNYRRKTCAKKCRAEERENQQYQGQKRQPDRSHEVHQKYQRFGQIRYVTYQSSVTYYIEKA